MDRRPATTGIGAGLLLCALAAAGCGERAEPAPRDGGPALGERAASDAMLLYRNEGCPMCHGELGAGVDGVGPPLRDLAAYWDRERLIAYLADPEAFRQANPDFDQRHEEEYGLEMPPYDYLAPDKRGLLADWLLAR
ncbi:MAG TPA: cytochrome c [Candidatus Polarisedimenticolaceae bacterium]|nr:cytochrome c [Candidatus Polarisedimenticolaceae bacterium]